MKNRGFIVPAGALALLAAACGDGGGSGNNAAASRLNTLAYVISDCHETQDGVFGSQALWILENGDTRRRIVDFPEYGALDRVYCNELKLDRFGGEFMFSGVLQRIAVSPSGNLVVFEVTSQHAIVGEPDIPPEAEGMFLVRSDGTGLRRLGPASRDPGWRRNSLGFFTTLPVIRFSRDERRITFTDIGPGPDGVEVPQAFLLDLDSGERMQVTRLPPLLPLLDFHPVLSPPIFVDDDTLGFVTSVADEGFVANTVSLDGNGEVTQPPPPLIPIPNAMINPTFTITDADQSAFTVNFPGPPETPLADATILEIMVTDGENTLQLTNFSRIDTGAESSILTPAIISDRVYFTASTNQLGTNPREVCQLFSMSIGGGDLRQLTQFDVADLPAGQTVMFGCLVFFPPSCYGAILGHDEQRGKILLHSSCDPLGTNPHGSQIFALDLDGSNLEQLTNARGLIADTDGFTTIELTGPQAYAQSD